jgi:hypothetical protein
MRDIAHAPKTLPRAEARSTPLDVALSIWHDSLKTVSVPRRSQGDANGTPPQEDTAAQPEAAALLALIWQLRDWSQRSSRQASVRSFELLAKQIDDEAARLGDQNRHGLRRELLASVVERMTWAKWERDWASFWELRRFVRSQWEGEAHLPPIATAWIAPRWAYQAKDALDRLFKQNSGSP